MVDTMLIKNIYITLLTIFVFVFEYFTRDILKKITIDYFLTSDKKRCEIFIYTEYMEGGLKWFMIFFLFNYVNVYSALFTVFCDAFCGILCNNMRLIYKENRPYVDSNSYSPCLYSSSFGNPCCCSMSVFLIFGAFYQAMSQKFKKLEKKFFCGFLWALSVSYTCYIRLLQNMVYLNQVFLGLSLGYISYFLFFDIICIKFEDFGQIKIFFKYKLMTYFVLIIVFILNTFIQFTIYPSIIFQTNHSEEIVKLQGIFPSKDNSTFLDGVNYIACSKMFDLIGIYTACILEYIYIFKEDDLRYERYNISEVNQNGMTLFNNTKRDLSLFRLILFCLCYFYLSFNAEVKVINNSTYLHLILSLPILQKLINTIVIFFILKGVVRFCALTNETLFHSLDKEFYIISS